MRKYAIDAIRNVGLLGHQGSGKTSLAEAMLLCSGAIDRMGRTDDGTTTTDFDPEEVKRNISINLALAPCEWKDAKVNVVDVPGYLDFQGEARSAMRVIDAAVLVTPAQGEPEVGFDIAWELATSASKPRAVFVSRMDRENADYQQVVDALRRTYGSQIAPVQVPIGSGDHFAGVVDLVRMRAYEGVGAEFHEVPVPSALEDVVAAHRERLVESAAEGDDALLEEFLDTGSLTDEQVVQGLRAGVRAGKLVPVLCGASTRNYGAASLLNLIVEAFPSPVDAGEVEGESNGVKAVRTPSASEQMSALVFKTLADPFVGQLTYFRVFSGSVRSDTHVLNANSGKDERFGQIYVIRGKTQEAVAEIGTGDIGGVAKLSSTRTGDTLCGASKPFRLPAIEFPKPIYEVAIVPRTKVDEDKLGPALQRVTAEDPAFHFRRDPVTGQTLISGMGETHVSTTVEKLRKFGATVETVAVKVPYRETIQSTAEGQGRHKKQTGGRGQYGDCHVRLEPLPRGAGFEFVDAIVGGSIPRQYIPAVEKGIVEAMAGGILSGNPVVDLRCTCYDGSYHDVDSSEAAFRMAGIQAFNNVAPKANPVILEPVVSVQTVVPESMMGDVMSDLSSRRGRIVGTEPLGGGRTRITATAPQAEMLRYAIDLRSITRGRGVFGTEFSHFEEVPAHVAQQIVAAYQKSKQEKEGGH
ncbi:MAG TPA: elongation factor G [Chthonomonadales bacterium]|nr:elongation factor G [Chthonomonadales bacterium]